MRKGFYGAAAAGVSSLVAASALIYKRQHDKNVKKAKKEANKTTSLDNDLDSHDVKPSRDFNIAKYAEIQRQHEREHKNINHITHRHKPISSVLQKRYKRM